MNQRMIFNYFLLQMSMRPKNNQIKIQNHTYKYLCRQKTKNENKQTKNYELICLMFYTHTNNHLFVSLIYIIHEISTKTFTMNILQSTNGRNE